jgi:hypothetical protein
MRNIDLSTNQGLATPSGLPRGRTSNRPCDPLRLTLLSLLIFFSVMVGARGEAQAKGKSKTWSPPIPAGRAAITLSVRTINAANVKVPAKVMWGRRLIGETPLSVPWPADSGPVDIVVQAPGHVPVHTRLYTFADDKVVVKMVDDEGKKTLFGYKREVPAAPAPGAAAPGAAAPGVAAPGVAAPLPTTPGAAASVPATPGAAASVPIGTAPKVVVPSAAVAPPPAPPPAPPAAVTPPRAAP